MKLSTRMSIFLIAFMLSISYSFAQVADKYVFSQQMGTYSEIASPDSIVYTGRIDNGTVNAINIGFPFIYNGTTYNQFTLCYDGWIQLGSTTSSNTYTPISYYSNVISAMGCDMVGNTNAQYSKTVLGAYPNRILVVQYKDVKTYSADNVSSYNFQFRLYESTNLIEIVYGSCTNTTMTSSYRAQVGISGSSTTDYLNRATSTNWNETVPGASNSDTCGLRAAITLPSRGLTFRFTPISDVVVGKSANTSTIEIGNRKPILVSVVLPNNAGATPVDVTSLTFNATGTANMADITSATLYYTATRAFSTTTQFGTAVTDVSGNFTFTGSTSLSAIGYYWLVFDVAQAATLGNTLQANLVSATIGGVVRNASALSSQGTARVISPITTTAVPTGIVNSSNNDVAILKVLFNNVYTTTPFGVNSLVFNVNSNSSAAQTSASVTSYKLYSTGTSSSFATTTLLGTATPVEGVLTFSLATPLVLVSGNNNYWLAYDIAPIPGTADSVFARLVNMTVQGVVYLPNTPNAYVAQAINPPIVTYANVTSNVNSAQNNVGIFRVLYKSLAATQASSWSFRVNSLTSPAQGSASVTTYKLYSTGTSSSFSSTTLVGSATTAVDGVVTITPTTPVSITSGNNYFWLAYDIAPASVATDSLFASLVSMTVQDVAYSSSLPSARVAVGLNTPITTVDRTSGIVSSETSNAQLLRALYNSNVATQASAFTFNVNSNTSAAQSSTGITAYKLYSTGTSTTFGTNTLLGTATPVDGIVTFTLSTPVAVPTGNNYYWLVADVGSVTSNADSVFARLVSITMQGTGYVSSLPNAYVARAIATPLFATAQTSGTQGSTTNNSALRVNFKVNTLTAPRRMQSMTFQTKSLFTNLPMNVNNVSGVRVYSAGSDGVLRAEPDSLFGTGTVSADGGNFTITGTKALSAGNNYFWLVYDVPFNATPGDSLFARVVNATVEGTTFAPSLPVANSAINVSSILNTVSLNPNAVLGGAVNEQMMMFFYVIPTLSTPLNTTQFVFNTNSTTSANVTLPADVSSAKVYFTGNSGSFNPATATLFGEGTFNNGVLTVNGTQALAEGANYFFLTYNVPLNATQNDSLFVKLTNSTVTSSNIVPVQPSVNIARIIKSTLYGDYLIGPNQTGARSFPSLDSAFKVINAYGMGGNTNLIISESYSEPANPTAINQWTESGLGNYFVNIYPSADYTIKGGGSYSGVINIGGAKRLTIDGRINGLGTGNHLTLQDTSKVNNSCGIYIASIGDSTTIRNLNIFADSNFYSGTIANRSYCIYSNAGSTKYFRVLNNRLKGASYGVYLTMGGSSNLCDGSQISGNIFGGNTPAEYITVDGIYIQYHQNLTITNNEMTNIQSALSSTTNVAGIDADYITNSTISGNRISKIRQNYSESASTCGAYGMVFGSSSNNNTIVNNAISDIHTANGNSATSYTASTFQNNPIGLLIKGGNNWNVWFNTISLYGTQLNSRKETVNTGTMSACFAIAGSGYTGYNVRNNAFSNAMESTQNVSKHLCFVVQNSTTPAMFSGLDYNGYWVGTNEPNDNYMVGYFAQEKITLGNWSGSFVENPIGAKETYSVYGNPFFTGLTNLVPTGASSLGYMGQTIATVPTDINGAARGTFPTIGAFNYNGTERVSPPITTAPVNNATCQPQLPTFRWDAVSGAGSYVLQYSTSSTFATQTEVTGITGTTYTLLAGNNLLLNTTYYWRMKTVPSVGELPSAWSHVLSFTVTGPVIAPVAILPINNTDVNQITTFTWSAVPNVSNYTLQISTSPTFATVYSEVNNINTTTYTWTLPVNYFNFYWRVKAISNCTNPPSEIASAIVGPCYTQPGFTNVQIGTMTTPDASAYSLIGPYANRDAGTIEHYLITKAELNAMGIVGASRITSLAFNVTALNGITNPLPGFTIKMKNTTATSMSGNSTNVGFSDCYVGNWICVAGMNNHVFTTPFDWDGNSNIEIKVCWWRAYTFTAQVSYTTTSYYSVRSAHSDNASYDCSYSGTTTQRYERPTMWLSSKSPWVVPTLLTPANNTVNIVRTATAFTWTAATNATTYQLQISTDPTFASTVADVDGITTVNHTLATQLNSVTRYYWRIKAKNGIQETKWSSAFTFITEGSIAAPELVSPYNNLAGFDEAAVPLSWNPVLGATKYLVQVSTSQDFTGDIVSIDNYTSTGWTVTPALIINTPYYWRVQAKNDAVNSPWSVTWKFNTRNATQVAVDNTAIGTAGNNIPSDNESYPTAYGFWHNGTIHQFLYKASELNAMGFTGPLSITSLGFNVVDNTDIDPMPAYTIKLKNTTATSLNSTLDHTNQTLCFTGSVTANIGWNDHTFTTPFIWDGTSNVLVTICNYSAYSYNATVQGQQTSYTSTRYVADDNMTSPCTSTASASTSTSRPFIRFAGVRWVPAPLDMHVVASDVSQASTQKAFIGSTNQMVVAYKVWMEGNANPINATSVTLNTNGTTNVNDIRNAKLWYTGMNPTMTDANRTQFGDAIPNPNGTLIFTGDQVLQAPNVLIAGKSLATADWNYFWLTYDVPLEATVGNYFDAQGISMIVNGQEYLPLHTNPEGSRKIAPTFAGDYTVGNTPSANFQDFKQAFDTLNNNAVRGDINFKVIADINQTAPANLYALNKTTTDPVHISIRPSSSTMRTITGNFGNNGSNTPLIGIDGVNNVTIDGRPTGTEPNGFLSFANSGTDPWTILLLNSKNSTIEYSTIRGGFTTGNLSPAVFIGSCDSLNFVQNKIMRADYGLYVNGGAASSTALIQNNTFGSNAPADYIGRCGMSVGNIGSANGHGPIIKNNTIFNVKTIETVNSETHGMSLGDAGTVYNAEITNNIIYGIYNNYPAGNSSIGLLLYDIDTSRIFNNVIYDISAKGNTTKGPFGVYLSSITNRLRIDYNSVNLYGTVSQRSVSSAIVWRSSNEGFELCNNVFANTITGPTGTKSYSVFVNSTPSMVLTDNNDLYAGGANAVLAYMGGTDRTTWADLRTVLPQNTNSINANPLFTANNNLVIGSNSPLVFNGRVITGITDDYLGNLRHQVYPAIGAYEYSGVNIIPAPSLVSPVDGYNPYMNGDTLSWTQVQEAAEYVVSISTSPDFVSPLAPIETAQLFTIPNFASLTPNVIYYWRVKAISQAGVESNWSKYRSFIVYGNLAAPTLLTPVDGQYLGEHATWAPVTGATNYDIQVSLNPNFEPTVYATNVTTTFATPTGLISGNIYYWRVRAARTINTLPDPTRQISDWSADRMFAVPARQFENPQPFTEVAFPPTGWTQRLGNGTNIWSRQTTMRSGSPHTDPAVARFYSWTGTGSELLISPAIDYTYRTADTAIVSFWMYRDPDYSTSADKIDVYASTTQGEGTLLGTINRAINMTPVVTAEGWYRYSFGIPRTFTGITYLVFKGTSTGGNYTYLDDIGWTNFPPPAPDFFGVPKLLAPANDAQGVSVNPVFTWREVGTADLYEYQLSKWADFLDTSIVLRGTTANLTFSATSLAEASTYYWRVRALRSSDTTVGEWSKVFTFHTISYCLPRYQIACIADFSEYIALVQLGGATSPIISNSTTCPINSSNSTGYSDYTDITGIVNLGQTIPLTVNNSVNGTDIGDIVVAYIDWNQNGILDEPGEVDTLISNANGTVYTANLTVPATATIGKTIMRIRMSNPGSELRPCDPATPVLDAPQMGEAEDYTLDVRPLIPNIVIGQLPANNCENSPISIPVTLVGNGQYNVNNVFTARLFNSNNGLVGTIGTLNGNAAGTINGTIPTLSGTAPYTIKVFASSPMNESAIATLSVNSAPETFNMTIANTNQCLNTPATIKLNGSVVGNNYQLKQNGNNIGTALPGTGDTLRFTINNNVAGTFEYTIAATNANNCSKLMKNQLNVVVNPIAQAQTVTVTNNGSFCVGTDGVVIGLNASQQGLTYSLLRNGTPVGNFRQGAANGAAISFGYVSDAGTYSVVGYYTAGLCETPMTNTVAVVNALTPEKYTISAVGDGTYCLGGEGVELQLDNSATGVTYNLIKAGTQGYVASLQGTGALLSFGLRTEGSYQVVATNGNCEAPMYGTAIVVATPPAVPTLATPANGAIDMTSPVVLTWNPVASCKTGYRVQISTSAAFTNPVEADVTEPTYSFALGTNGTTYYWRVKTINGTVSSNYCTERTFKMREGNILTIALAQGWNLISSNLTPLNAAVTNIWNGNANMKFMRNNAGQIFVPSETVNTIGNWDVSQGYQVYMAQTGTVDIIGEIVNTTTTTIPVAQGWNIVSYLRQTGLNAPTALSSLGNTVVVAKNGKGEMYMPAFGINTFEAGTVNAQMMIPGRGYQIYTTAAGTLNYNVVAPRISSAMSSTEPHARFLAVSDTRTGKNASMVFISQSIADGTEIGVFNTRNELVGNGVMNGNRAAITLWGDNELTQKVDGAADGESLTIKTYNSQTGVVSNVSVADVTDIVTGTTSSTLKFANNGIFVARGSQESMSGVFTVSANPNPATTAAEVSYTVAEDGAITIDVFDLNGNKVTRLYDGASKANHTMKLDAEQLASGVYTIVLTQGDRTASTLIVIAK